MANSTTCPPLGGSAPSIYIPELGDKGSINYCVVQAGFTNDTASRVAQCCSPNPLQRSGPLSVPGGCYDWCQLPDTYLANGTATESDIYSSFNQCLQHSGSGELINEFQCFTPGAKSAAPTITPGVGANLVFAWAAAFCLWQLFRWRHLPAICRYLNLLEIGRKYQHFQDAKPWPRRAVAKPQIGCGVMRRFAVAPLHRSLVGDKIVLPQAALEQLLAAAPTTIQHGPADTRSNFDPFNPYSYAAERNARALAATSQQQLPHPLTFRLVNPDNGRAVYAGIKEFSAEEDQIILSPFLEHILGLDIGPDTSGENIKTSGHALPRITVHAKQLPKGIFVKLRPLEAGYDPEDWKSLLEEHMRKNYTTLTKGELLTVPAGRDEFRFLIDEFKPDVDGVCVVDTDLEVDIEALNEEQARETLTKIAAKRSRAPGLEIEVNPTAPGELCVFASPFGPRQRARPRINEHVSAAFEFPPGKRLKLLPAKDDLEGADAVWVSVHVPEVAEEEHPTPRTFTIRAILPERKTSSTDVKDNVLPSSDEVATESSRRTRMNSLTTPTVLSTKPVTRRLSTSTLPPPMIAMSPSSTPSHPAHPATPNSSTRHSSPSTAPASAPASSSSAASATSKSRKTRAPASRARSS
ncbi:hypothetical protein FH972_025040 [Carpinus fangiana]|uniref:Uncharacterized protein n=1 Tax=Carpinus fangiana TaxID=176857 RepID=A0A5N6L065_9ROSI|nr:hypothetical protein FH972_025040 [Carpinus fangiana]